MIHSQKKKQTLSSDQMWCLQSNQTVPIETSAKTCPGNGRLQINHTSSCSCQGVHQLMALFELVQQGCFPLQLNILLAKQRRYNKLQRARCHPNLFNLSREGDSGINFSRNYPIKRAGYMLSYVSVVGLDPLTIKLEQCLKPVLKILIAGYKQIQIQFMYKSHTNQ